jgi:hypothetical protein
MKDSFLCTLSFLKISVASSKCWFSKILQLHLLAFARGRKMPCCCSKQFASWHREDKRTSSRSRPGGAG